MISGDKARVIRFFRQDQAVWSHVRSRWWRRRYAQNRCHFSSWKWKYKFGKWSPEIRSGTPCEHTLLVL